jgi:hypothetical protein
MPVQTLPRRAIRLLTLVASLALTAAVLAPAQAGALAPAPPAAWQPAAAPPSPQGAPVPVALADGSALVLAGGTAVHRFDPANGAWTVAAPLPQPRTEHAAVRLADGRVLVTGGADGASASADAFLYDPAADAWTPVAPMATARSGHFATLLGDGTVLVGGGFNGSTRLASAERYDPVTDSWSAAAPMAAPRVWTDAVAMPDGSAVVAGGASDVDWLATVERFDPATGAWTRLPDLPGARAHLDLVVLADGSLVAIGGAPGVAEPAGLDRLLPGAGRWTSVPGSPRHSQPNAALLPGGTVLIVGGRAAWLFDPVSGRTAAAGSLAMFHGSPVTALSDGTVLVSGGAWPESAVTAERFTPRAFTQVVATDFGEQTTGRRGAVVQVPVQTAGDVPLIVRSIAVEGAHAGDFTVASDSCRGDVVPTRATCFVGLRFTAGGDGPRAATLVLGAGQLAGGRIEVPLSGIGVPAPVVVGPPVGPPVVAPPARRPAGRRAAVTPRLRCAARKGRRVVCTGAPKTLGSGSVRLSRAGIVHATGTVRNGRLTLKVRRRLFDRRYTLVVGKRRPVKVVID